MIAIFDEDGSGTVDFQEFIAGLSAFSSKGNKEEKLRCTLPAILLSRPIHSRIFEDVDGSCLQGL